MVCYVICGNGKHSNNLTEWQTLKVILGKMKENIFLLFKDVR